MRTIRIFINDIEIDYVEKTLKLKKENTAFSTSFKVAHSRIPFLVIENKNTIATLGNRDLTSRNKVKVVSVTVIEAGVKFFGALEVLEYLDGFRKVNIKYASKIFDLLNMSIRSFMPIKSVIPDETDPVAFAEETENIETGYHEWYPWAATFLDDVFPQTKWQFPTLRHEDRFGTDLEETDTWYHYKKEINKYDENYLLYINNYTNTVDELSVRNVNVVSPYVFLLSPLYYAFTSIGWKLKGEFINSAFIRRLLLFSKEDNMSKTLIEPTIDDLNFPNNIVWNFIPQDGIPFYQVSKLVEITEANTYIIKYRFEFAEWPAPFEFNYYRLQVIYPGETAPETLFGHQRNVNTGNIVIEGEVSFTATEDNVGQDLTLIYASTEPEFPFDRSIGMRLDSDSIDFYYAHPTIDFSRYVPNWTVAKYLNEIQSLFNVSIEPDDFKNHLTINFNENIDSRERPEIIKKSLEIKSYDSVANISFRLKYGNDDDESIFITSNGVEIYDNQSDNFNTKIESAFKYIPSNNYTSAISESIISNDGVGLMIYDPIGKPFTSNSYNSQTLKFFGPSGIYEVYWKNWLNFRLNASSLEIIGPFTNIEIEKIQKAKAIYVDHQRYRIVSLEFSEAVETINMVKFEVESVNH